MAEQVVLLSQNDLTVLGPPEAIDVLVDIGPTGTRGSQVFVGSGDPNIVSIGQSPILNDLYINTSPGADYGYLYQYLARPGGNVWVQVLKMNPTIYSQNHITSYTDGEAQIVLPISNIVTVTGSPLSAENFSIRYSLASTQPISSSMSIPPLAGTGENLVINFVAVTWNGTSWENLNTEVTTHLFITII